MIYCSDSDINTASLNVKIALDSIPKWCKKWRIALNPNKCEAKMFTLRRSLEPTKLKILNSEINWNPSDQAIKYLGVYLDKKLSWKFHINKKLNVAWLSKLYPLLNGESSIKKKPLLIYDCPIWGTATNLVLNHIKMSWVYQNKSNTQRIGCY